MQGPTIPKDEGARLQALRQLGVLDTPAEERFDRYTRLARRLFDVPIALVSLVDADRQWFKSRQGLEALETSREISFCGHAIHSREPFVVENTVLDERFADNPLVTDDPNIRFYAGCPLAAPGGQLIGTLCIIDRNPRTLTQEDLETLRDVADMVGGELGALHMATTDVLTGLCNRRGFDAACHQLLALCNRNSISASAIAIDLDGFKQINDEFGHDAGDEALVEFARALRVTFRDSDVVGRLGGDEFAVVLSGTDLRTAEHALARLAGEIERANQVSGRGWRLAFSWGLAESSPGNTLDVDALLREADAEMYVRKRTRKHQAA